MNLWWRLIKFGFRLLYNELAFTYDSVSKIVSIGAWRCWQRSALNYLPSHDVLVKQNTPILEIAHGTGDLQIDLQQAGYNTIGYDLSPNMGRIAKRKLHKNNLQADLIRGKAQQLPFQSNQFPAVITTFPTAFIIAEETLTEINRVLKIDGVLIIVSSGTFTGGGIIKSILDWAYRITGQRGEDTQAGEFLAYINQFGFNTKYETIACPRSLAHLIIAVKMD